jgi:uncharacterized protein
MLHQVVILLHNPCSFNGRQDRKICKNRKAAFAIPEKINDISFRYKLPAILRRLKKQFGSNQVSSLRLMFKKNNSFLLLGISVSVTLAIFLFQPKVIFDYDFESFFPQDDNELFFYQEFRKNFENDNDYLLIALGRNPDVFDSIFLDQSESFVNALNQLEDVIEVVSLLDIEDPTISPFGISGSKVLNWESPEDLKKSQSKIMQSEQWNGNLISMDSRYLLVIVKNRQNISKEDGDNLYNSIQTLIADSDIEEVYSAGKIKAQGEFVRLLQEEFSFFLGISFVLIVAVLFLIFRNWWGILVPVVVLAIGILWTVSFSLYTGKALDVMSVMQPTILSVIGLAALVHFFNHFINLSRKGFGKPKAIEMAFSELVFAVFLTCLTTSLGFLSLYLTSIPSLKYFGLYTGLGVMLMFISVITVGPGLLYLFSPSNLKSKNTNEERWRVGMRMVFIWILGHQRTVVFSFLAVSLMFFYAGSKVQINGYILDNLPRDHELVEEFRFFDREFGGSKPLEFYLESGEEGRSLLDLEVLEEMDKLETFIGDNYETAALLSPLTIVKKLNQAQNSGNPKAFILPSRGQLLRMKEYIPGAIEILPSKVLSADFTQGRISTRTEDFGSRKSKILNGRLNDFLENEIDQNLLQVKLTGTSHLIDISHESVTWQMAKGLGLAFIIVAVIMGFLFKSWRISTIVLVPNIIPLLWMLGIMGFLNIEMKLTTAILFTVAFGIAVDDSIHFMSKLNIELAKGKSWLYALKRTFLETGKAIILTTAILVSGFSILIFSQFGVTYYSGLLISMALVFALVADLILLPVLLIQFKFADKIK